VISVFEKNKEEKMGSDFLFLGVKYILISQTTTIYPDGPQKNNA
jgi:hypothetical protein